MFHLQLDITRYNAEQGILASQGNEASVMARGHSAAAEARNKASMGNAATLMNYGQKMYDGGFLS